MPAPPPSPPPPPPQKKKIRRLVARFSEQLDTYKAPSYNETLVRRDFIDPFFAALGWDVVNEQGLAEHLREVVHEPRFQAGGLKAPDYSFRVGGTRRFFVDVKKPSVDLRRKPAPALQLRRYAWSANLAFSVLTDFEELALYDCRTAPRPSDDASTGRLFYFTFRQYDEQWDRIAGLLSKEAVMDGSLARLATDNKPKRGSIAVDDAFLGEIESWRSSLASDLASHNPALGTTALNYTVQKIIDRIIFLRICEDRKIEGFGKLESLTKGKRVYARLLAQFRDADAVYGSGLFHLQQERHHNSPPDTLTPSLKIDDATLHKIFQKLYPPRCPYVFAAMPAAILGQVYERFLGKVITLGAPHEAQITEKPEVRKAGGVYYTPTYIVDCIVAAALGPLLADKTPRQVSKLQVLDPACGSGSFLIGVYQFLLDWHLGFYSQDPEKHSRGKNPRLYQADRREWRLTTGEKKRILLNNVYGVDVDPQAVEVSKLSLLLKVLEGETLFKERALPDLGANIKCGNTLIDHDFAEEEFGEPEETEPINPFDWRAEFPETFSRPKPGFDAVLGNPPYVDSEWMTSHRPATRAYCASKYEGASGNWDLFCAFIDKSIQLLRHKGHHSFIVPNKVASADYAAAVRRLLATDNRLLLLRDYSRVPVFPVSVYPIVYIVQKSGAKGKRPETVRYEKMAVERDGVIVADERDIDYNAGFSQPERTWPIFAPSGGHSGLLRLLDEHPALESVATVLGGATVSEAYDLLPLLSNKERPSARDLRVLNSGIIDPHTPLWGARSMRYLRNSFEHPVVEASNQPKLPATRLEQARTPKVIIAGMTKVLECVADTDGEFLAAKSTTIVLPGDSVELVYLAAVLNSRLLTYLFKSMFGGLSLQGGYLRVGPPQIKKLPLRLVKKGDTRGAAVVKKIRKWVSALEDVSADLAGQSVPHERETLARRAGGLHARIDEAICGLYGLSAEETRVVLSA